MSYLYSQLENLSLPELIAVTIRDTPEGEAVLGILSKFESLQLLMDASIEELTEVKGIGHRKATLLKASLELGRRLYSAQ